MGRVSRSSPIDFPCCMYYLDNFLQSHDFNYPNTLMTFKSITSCPDRIPDRVFRLVEFSHFYSLLYTSSNLLFLSLWFLPQ